MSDAPRITVVGGPNGAGKTTFVRAYLEEYPEPYLSADAIAAELRPEAVEEVAVAAGRLFVEQIVDHIRDRKSFIVESTLSGRTLASHLRRAAGMGFKVHVNLVCVDTPDTSVARVRERKRGGGHHVPEEDVRRRFRKSMANFWRIYAPLADDWAIYWNAEDSFIPVSSGKLGDIQVNSAGLFQRFLAEIGESSND